MQAGAMRSFSMLVLCVTTLSACRDQRRACTEAFGDGPTLDEGLLNRCITEKWTSRQVACVQKSGAGMGMAFCFEAGE